MEKFERRIETVEAIQWKAGTKIEDMPEGVYNVPGMSGYQGRLAYLDVGTSTLTIRPNDYLIKNQEGKYSVMIESEFEKTYKVKKVANGKSSANNSSKGASADNFLDE